LHNVLVVLDLVERLERFRPVVRERAFRRHVGDDFFDKKSIRRFFVNGTNDSVFKRRFLKKYVFKMSLLMKLSSVSLLLVKSHDSQDKNFRKKILKRIFEKNFNKNQLVCMF
jgi:hypothetical protein